MHRAKSRTAGAEKTRYPHAVFRLPHRGCAAAHDGIVRRGGHAHLVVAAFAHKRVADGEVTVGQVRAIHKRRGYGKRVADGPQAVVLAKAVRGSRDEHRIPQVQRDRGPLHPIGCQGDVQDGLRVVAVMVIHARRRTTRHLQRKGTHTEPAFGKTVGIAPVVKLVGRGGRKILALESVGIGAQHHKPLRNAGAVGKHQRLGHIQRAPHGVERCVDADIVQPLGGVKQGLSRRIGLQRRLRAVEQRHGQHNRENQRQRARDEPNPSAPFRHKCASPPMIGILYHEFQRNYTRKRRAQAHCNKVYAAKEKPRGRSPRGKKAMSTLSRRADAARCARFTRPPWRR